MLCIPLIFCFGYKVVVALLQQQLTVEISEASINACVNVIVLLDTSKNKSPNKTR